MHTLTWLIPLIAILVGFVGLLWSADRFVGGSAALARGLGVSPLIIGLTIVSFGTSAPEILVSISASLKGAGELAVGNALGSNLANIGLVLGITALIAPLPVQPHLLRREIPLLLGITALAGLFLVDARLGYREGAALLLLLPPSLWLLMRRRNDEPQALSAEVPAAPYRLTGPIFWFLLGLAVLIGCSELLVWGARELALQLGVSPLVVGLTVIAVGTSLPELAASVVSALKGHHDIALGNIIGSNIFNLLAVMAIPALLDGPTMAAAVFWRDYTAMALLTLMLAAAALLALWGLRLGRTVGVLLLAGYAAYLAALALAH